MKTQTTWKSWAPWVPQHRSRAQERRVAGLHIEFQEELLRSQRKVQNEISRCNIELPKSVPNCPQMPTHRGAKGRKDEGEDRVSRSMPRAHARTGGWLSILVLCAVLGAILTVLSLIAFGTIVPGLIGAGIAGGLISWNAR